MNTTRLGKAIRMPDRNDMKVRVEDSSRAPLRVEVASNITEGILNSVRATYMSFTAEGADGHPYDPIVIVRHDQDKNRVTVDVEVKLTTVEKALEWRNAVGMNDLWSNCVTAISMVLTSWAKGEPKAVRATLSGVENV